MNKVLLPLLLLALGLMSCTPANSSSSSSSLTGSSSSITSSSEENVSVSIPDFSIDTSSWPSEPINESTTLDFYSINDFHGAVGYNLPNKEPGIARLATYFDEREAANPNGTVLVSAGDMWQGSADSNITHGELVTDCMNAMNFDAMEIGNHEFDWTDSFIYANRDRADFPFLGGNIIDKTTGQIAEFADAYTMIERQGVRIGIIGVIGSTLESSILTSAVANYNFVSPISIITQSAQILRDHGANIVIVLDHNDSVPTNVLSSVDAVFNAHSHETQNEVESGVPEMQGLYNGRAISHVSLTYNKTTNLVTLGTHEVVQNLTALPLTEASDVQTIYDDYYNSVIKTVKEEVVGTLTGEMSKAQLGKMAVESMLDFGTSYGASVAFHNTGGIRATLPSGTVTFGDVYAALPFDNDLIICSVTGLQLKNWLANGGNYVVGASRNTNTFADGSSIVDGAAYKIIAISYLSEDTMYPHDVANQINTHALVRDLVRQAFLDLVTVDPSDYN